MLVVLCLSPQGIMCFLAENWSTISQKRQAIGTEEGVTADGRAF